MRKTWQYNGVDTYGNIWMWCHDNLTSGTWRATADTFFFYEDKSYIVFLLRWS